ncbi:MAG TPA: hypothetical protein VL866_11180 [Pyrinomonadaceae bacterium]|nr:hypothetical protein [Pyrinomonadaceae bacterium]
MRVENQSHLSPDKLREIQAAIPHQENLKDMMIWAFSSPGDFEPTVVVDVVVQDEFTHDVIVPWRDGLVLVYDTT